MQIEGTDATIAHNTRTAAMPPVKAESQPMTPTDAVTIGASPPPGAAPSVAMTTPGAAPSEPMTPPAAPATPAQALRSEAEYWGASIESAYEKRDDLVEKGADYALAALSAHPAVGPEIAAHFARTQMSDAAVSLVSSAGIESLGRCARTPANRQAVADEVGAFASRLLQECRRDGLPMRSYAEAFRGMADVVQSDWRPGALMSDVNLADVRATCEAMLYSSTMQPEEDDRQWEEVGNVARVATRLSRDSGGRLDCQFLFDWLAEHPSSNAIALSSALEVGRPVPDGVMASTLEQTKSWIGGQDDRNFFYNQDWFANRLDLLRQAFDARGDDVGRVVFAQEGAAESKVAALTGLLQKHLIQGKEPDPIPAFRLRVGDQEIAIGGAPERVSDYTPEGPGDRRAALDAIGQTSLIGGSDFWEKAGDQALLALADPATRPEAIDRLGAVFARPNVGDGVVRDVTRWRMPVLEKAFPEQFEAIRSGIVEALAKGIAAGGEGAEDLVYYIDAACSTREDKMRLYTAAIDLYHEPGQGESSLESSRGPARLYQRGIAFYGLESAAGSDLAEVPASALGGARSAADRSRKWLDGRLESLHESYTENGSWKEASPRAKEVLGQGR